MNNKKISNSIQSAFNSLIGSLPSLIGSENWPNIEKKIKTVQANLSQANNEIQRSQYSLQLLELVQPYEEAREKIKIHMNIYALKHEILKNVNVLQKDKEYIDISAEKIARKLFDTFLNYDQKKERGISIKSGEITESKSVKLKNININFEITKFSTSLATILTASHSIFKDPHPFVIVVGILLLIAQISNLTTIKLSENDSTVFWGLIQSKGNELQVDEETILKKTNRERINIGLNQLGKKDVTRSLKVLQSIKAIEEISDSSGRKWKIIEKYKIK